MLPPQKDIEIPLLEVLNELGGQGKPKEIYPLVTKKFPQIRDIDLAERVPTGANKWTNRIQFVRQKLVDNGEIDRSQFGVWKITEIGKKRLGGFTESEVKQPEGRHPEAKQLEVQSLEAKPLKPTEVLQKKHFWELYEDYETSFRSNLLDKLYSLSSSEFEQFSRRLLNEYGFVDVIVTQPSRDGGIDGHGKLRVGLAMMNVAFQCKRWEGNVGRIEVDKFRGAIQGEFEQGIFFSTSDFTNDAKDASLKKGAVPIILLNGEIIVNLMIEKGFGVERVPLYVFYDRPTDFIEKGDE